MNSMKRVVLLIVVLLITGCAHAVSEEMRQRAAQDIPAVRLFEHPQAHKGRLVILGGMVVHSRNEQDGTYIEVLEKPLDGRGRPKDTDESAGRFLVFSEKYLDTAIYAMGKEITVAGEVLGSRRGKIGEMEYDFPLLRGGEIHLFKPREGLPVHFGIGIGIGGSF